MIIYYNDVRNKMKKDNDPYTLTLAVLMVFTLYIVYLIITHY